MIPKIEAIFAPLSDARSPGLAVLVRRRGRTVFEHGYGVRDLNSLRCDRSGNEFSAGILHETIHGDGDHAARS